MSSKPIPDSRMGGLFSTKKESGVTGHESRVMSNEMEKTAVLNHESEVTTNESRIMTQESRIMSNESRIDPKILEWAVTQGRKDPRISGYSPIVVSVLRYLRRTTPEFSMSDVASSLLENAIREKYPELSKQVEKALDDEMQ